MSDFMKSAIDILNRNPKEDENGFVGEIIEVGGLKLKIKKFLAAGGFSNVYLAANTKGELYAVKRLTGFDKEGCDKILNEIDLHKRLCNENIVNLYGVSYVQKTLGSLKVAEYLLLTEFCSQSLSNLIYDDLPMRIILALMNQTVSAVNYLHNLQPIIIHRDIKLENFLISVNGSLKLCDFGSATTEIVEPTEAWNMQKRSNLQDEIFTNTSPMYRAPEMLDTWNNYPIGPKVDIWALGCVFFCILYKKHPFDDAAKLRIINGNYLIPNISKYICFQTLLEGCLVVNPRNRIDSEKIIKNLKIICESEAYSEVEKPNLLQKDVTSIADVVNIKLENEKPVNGLVEEEIKSEENLNPVHSFLSSNSLLSTIKDGANSFLKNFIGTSSKVLSSMQNSKTNVNIYHLTSRIMVSYQTNIEILQKYLENFILPSNISVYNFSCSNSRMAPPVRTIDINQFNKDCEAKVLDLEHLYYLIEEMFGLLSSGEKYALVLQGNRYSNITAVIVSALFLYAGLTQFVEDALQIFAVKVHPLSLFASEFRYLNYIKRIIKGNVPHNKILKMVNMSFENFGHFCQIIGDCKLLIEIFENNRLVYTQDQFSLLNAASNNEIKINKNVSGNILVNLAFLKNSGKFSEKSSKVKIGKLQFHTGFIQDKEKTLKFSKEDIDLDNDCDFNFVVLFNYSLTNDETTISQKWGNVQLKKDPKKLFSSSYEYNEIIENFVDIQGSQDSLNDIEKNIENIEANVENISTKYQDIKYENCDIIVDHQQINTDVQTNDIKKEVPILLDLSLDNLEHISKPDILSETGNYNSVGKSKDQLLDIFGESFQNISINDNISNIKKSPEIKIDPFADLLGSSLNNCDELTNLKSKTFAQNELHEVIPEIPLKQTSNEAPKPVFSKVSTDSSQFPFSMNINSTVFETTPKTTSQPSSDFFADLLGQQGYNFPKKTSSEPKTINDLRNKEILINMDEENIKIFKWTEGKRANIRALLCSMHNVLWEDAKWSKCEMHQLITLAEVKKAYRKACLAVHPDKHIGTENERLSKMIFMELNTAWSNFNAENS